MTVSQPSRSVISCLLVGVGLPERGVFLPDTPGELLMVSAIQPESTAACRSPRLASC